MSVEVERRPRPGRRELADAHRAAIAAHKRETAAEYAADMEMGTYVDANGVPWPERPFVVSEVLRRLGCGESEIRASHYPKWYPGTVAFRRFVEWKVAVRHLADRPDLTDHPTLGRLLSLAIDEMGRRLALDPASVGARELTELITKLYRLIVTHEAEPSAPSVLPSAAASGIVMIRETILALPPGPGREAAAAALRELGNVDLRP